MRLTSIQQPEDLDVINCIGLHVWTRALRRIYHGDKFDIFAWQWQYFEYVWDSEMSK